MLWYLLLNLLFFTSFSSPQEGVIFQGDNFIKNYNALGVEIAASSAVVVEKESGRILLAKNEKEVRPLASITKLMSALVLLDSSLDWRRKIVIPQRGKIKSHFLRPGDELSLDDLLKIGLIGSDNWAMSILAHESGASQQDFVDLMNKKAQELGMKNTHFVDPTGLDPDNVSTALDITRLARSAFSRFRLSSILSLPYYTVRTKSRFFTVYNTNKLVGYNLENRYTFLLGKTGYLKEAGYCLANLAKDNKGREVISVVLGAPRLEERFLDTKRIVYWVFENWQW